MGSRSLLWSRYVASATALPPGETRNSARSPSSVCQIRTPAEWNLVTTPFWRVPLNFGTFTRTANEAAGLSAVVPGGGPSGIATAALTQRLNVAFFTFAVAVAGASSPSEIQPTQARSTSRAQRFLVIEFPSLALRSSAPSISGPHATGQE